MPIRKIDLSKRVDRKQFIQLPFDLYQHNSYWVPPLRSEIFNLLDREQNPFFSHSEAEFFLAEKDNQIAGRIAAIYNTRYNKGQKEKTGFFYFFESINEPAISQALFERAFSWFKKRGIEKVYGPKGLLQGDGIGLLVRGFDKLPAMGIPYNFPYYEKMILDAGFEKVSDYFSGYLKSTAQVPERVIKVAQKVKKRRNLRVKKFTSKDELLAVAPEIRKVYNAAFASGEGFSPISEEEMTAIAERILSIADPRLIKLVYKGDQLIGFLFAYPNIGEGLQKAHGRMWPLGWFHLWRASKSTKYLDMNGIGLLPDHQGVGATAVLYLEMEKTVREYDYEHIETVQIREDNQESMSENDLLNVTWHKTHRVYQKKL